MAPRTVRNRKGIRLAGASPSGRDGTRDLVFEAFVREHHERVRRLVAWLARHEGQVETVVRQIFTELHLAHSQLTQDRQLTIRLYRIAVERSVEFTRPRVAGGSGDREALLLQSCIQSLSVNLRAPLCLKLAGASYEEIADTLELSVDTVRTRLFLAREALARSVARKKARDEP